MLVAFLARAQESLSLHDAVRLALSQNKAIEAANAGVDKGIAGIAEARSGLLPKVNYSESWARSDNPVFVFSSLLTQHQFGAENFQIGPLNRPDFLNNFQSLISAEQPLYDAGRTKRATRSAEIARDLAREDVRRSEFDVIAQTAKVYYDAQLESQQVQSLAEAMRSAEADLARAETRRTAGMATDVDVLSIRVHVSAVREQQILHGANLDVARAALNDAIGLPLDTQRSLATPLAVLNVPMNLLSELEESGATKRPETREATLASALAANQSAEAKANLFLPKVDLHGAFEADRQRFYDRGGANWLVSIGLRWNLFNGSADRAKIQESVAAERRSKADQQRAESAIRLQVRRAWADLQAAQQRIESASASVAEARESLRISQNRYEAGLSTVTDLLRNESALTETQTRYLTAIHDQRVAAVMLEWAAGTLAADAEALN